jgi:hypothetical protein
MPQLPVALRLPLDDNGDEPVDAAGLSAVQAWPRSGGQPHLSGRADHRCRVLREVRHASVGVKDRLRSGVFDGCLTLA